MELYKKIDMINFDRAEYFQYFMSVGTTIEFTVKVDITKTLEKSREENTHLQSLIRTLLLYELFRGRSPFPQYLCIRKFV